MAKADALIALALSQVGTREDPPGSNRQPYGAELDTLPWYLYKDSNGKIWIHKVNGFDWCTQLHDDLFITAFGIDTARKILYRPQYNNYGAVVTYSYNYYKAKNRIGSTPKKGCSIFFKRNGEFTHIGIVVDFDNKYVYTVEGNAGLNNQYVVKNKYLRTDCYIAGYGYPDYDEEETPYIAGGLYTKVCNDYLNIRMAPALSGMICGRLDGHPVIRCCGVSIDDKENIWLDIGNLWICAKYGNEVYMK